MAQLLVGTVAQAITAVGRGRLIVQNLGPGNLYLDVDVTATAATSIKVPSGSMYEFPTDAGSEASYSVIADAASTDVRYMIVGNN